MQIAWLQKNLSVQVTEFIFHEQECNIESDGKIEYKKLKHVKRLSYSRNDKCKPTTMNS